MFDTEFGVAGIIWSNYGIRGFQFPLAEAEESEKLLARNFPNARSTEVPDEIKMLTRRIARHLRGETQDFSNVRIDLSGEPPFDGGLQLQMQSWRIENALPAKCGV